MTARIHRPLWLPLALLLAACQAPGPAAPPAAAADPAPAPTLQQAPPAPPGSLQTTLRLIRHHWRLVAAVDAGGHRIDALFARPEAPLQLDFNASLVSVGNACNVLSAHHTVEADSLTIDAFASSMRACTEPALAALDGAIAHRLQGRLAMQLDAGTPPRLVLTNAAGDVLTFAGVPTTAPRFDGPPQSLF
ncbi:META domain-containing protein [Thermomonas alba]|uniref:META domain-containing protein n=1 Tax=Thermomonas alba TaxID=2888525 RepID=UPI001F04249C|nr:META domain-containing protein [Thermomonas alba]